MNKQGIELTMNTIIIAALALLVMLVLIVVFTGGFGDVVGKIKGILGGTDYSNCIVVNNPTVDADGDGYRDDMSYDTSCKVNGKTEKKSCPCDTDKTNPNINLKTDCPSGCDGIKK
jgi:hypothetical protein